MRTQTVVLSVGSGALALGIGLAAPAVADGGWAAIAASPSTGHGGLDWSRGGEGKQAVESAAISDCEKQGNPGDCAIIASSAQCVAFAHSASNRLKYAGGTGPTAEAATNSAVASLEAKGVSDAQVEAARCSSDPK